MSKYLIIALLLFSCFGNAQKITVLDGDSKEQISNVAVFNKDKSKIALTDFDGVFNASVFGYKERITLKHVGYQEFNTTKQQLQRQGNKVYLVMKAQELDEVVMSVSKWEQQKRDIPNKIISLDARTITFTTPQTSADLLQNSGKVFVQKSQLGGGSPMIRGFATNRLLLSVDGVRMNNAIFRGGNVQNVISIDPYTIKNTEVIFGPGSVIYGSDAIGGVMNFYTNKPMLSENDSLLVSGKANYRFSSANNENTLHADVNLGLNKWASFTSMTYNNFQDLRMGSHGPDSYLRNNYVQTVNGEDELVENRNPKKQVTTGYDQINMMQKFLFKPNSKWDLNLGAYYSETSNYSRYDRLIRPTSDGLGLRSAEWYYGPQKWFMGNAQLLKKGNGKVYDGLKLGMAYQFFEESRINRDFQDEIKNTTKEQVDAYNFNVDFENKKIGDFKLYYGSEYIYNKVRSNGFDLNVNTNEKTNAASRYPDGSSWQSLAGYVNGEYKAKPNFTLMSGLRYSHVWVNAVFDDTFYNFPFEKADLSTGALTGSLGFSWFPRANLQVTLNGSTGFRAPNIDDVGKIFDSEPGSVVVPNPDLEPEYAYNAEIGVQRNINDKIILKGAAYYTYLVDALVRRDFSYNGVFEIMYGGELSNVQAIQNAAKAYVYGFEFGLEAYLSEQWSLSSNLTLTEGVEEEDDGTETAARHAAPTFGDFHIVWKNQRIRTDLFVNYNGEVAYDDLAMSEQEKDYIYAIDENGNPFSPSWYTLNFRSQYDVSRTIKITTNVENFTDQRYRTYSSGIVAPGINVILGLGYYF
ncbi:hemoglobin/transferrin/lactoferrin receptor protein [Maribacter dokdonensis]|uniref:Hemoglobin/transferrin/lactoferrin receptor protein n=1 Tax=Maribacter dokdonensis TaxID=320912 RepID=A0ABY0UYW4_9FLAO|nr:TonB-dependent receptor [Maribacter dokdonensis]SDT39903.1 hemoglobin/transferrin/lactoferrin receptor protein [Maribacter dokdonensis]